MKTMVTDAELAEPWRALTGRFSAPPVRRDGRMEVPVLLQDPIALLMHFTLYMPADMGKGKLSCLTLARSANYTYTVHYII